MTTKQASGLIETRGIVALTAGIEAMCKTADVQCVAVTKVGMGYLAATIEGTVAAVRQAIEVGSEAVRQHGELRTARLYPRPADASVRLVENGSRELLAGSQALDRGGK